ncbi:MAG: hypothetical protein GC155_02830 [Alphaproteobacteria bacterium]|nr:hypothetical protein [Alphaproteobacteria bacterium]
MSGVAKDETNSPETTENAAASAADGSPVSESGASGEPSQDQPLLSDPTAGDEPLPELKMPDLKAREAKPDFRADRKAEKAARRAPHLRVVADNDGAEEHAEPEPVAQRIGAAMRAQRLSLGYDLETVSKETRIAVSHLRAIEDMTPNVIGQPVYVKGHIRTFARHLKMDPDAVLAQYKDECAILADPEKQDIAPPVTTRKLPVAVPVLGLLVIALVGAGGVYFLTYNGQSPAPSGATAAAPGPAGITPMPDALSVPIAPPLHIVAVKEARIEVRGADGTKFLARVFEPGESYSPRVGAGWTVTTNDGSAFEWRLGDESLGLFTPDGGPVYAQSVDLAMKREPVAPPVVDTPPPAPVAPSAAETNARVSTPAASGEATATTPAKPKPAATAPAGGPPPMSAARITPKPRAKPPAQITSAAPETTDAAAPSAPAQIGTAPVPTAAPAQAKTPAAVTDPSLLAYPPPG